MKTTLETKTTKINMIPGKLGKKKYLERTIQGNLGKMLDPMTKQHIMTGNKPQRAPSGTLQGYTKSNGKP